MKFYNQSFQRSVRWQWNLWKRLAVRTQELLTILENNVETSNVPRIGVGNNMAHPATLANLAPAGHQEKPYWLI
jgi:hypothetical protein